MMIEEKFTCVRVTTEEIWDAMNLDEDLLLGFMGEIIEQARAKARADARYDYYSTITGFGPVKTEIDRFCLVDFGGEMVRMPTGWLDEVAPHTPCIRMVNMRMTFTCTMEPLPE